MFIAYTWFYLLFISHDALINSWRFSFSTSLPNVCSLSDISSNIVWALRHYSKSLFWIVSLLIKAWVTSYFFYCNTWCISLSLLVIPAHGSLSFFSSSCSSCLSSLSKSELNLSLEGCTATTIFNWSNSINSCAREWCYKRLSSLSKTSPLLWMRIYWSIFCLILPSNAWTILLKYPHKIGYISVS